MYFKRDRFVKNGSILFTSLSGKQRCCFFFVPVYCCGMSGRMRTSLDRDVKIVKRLCVTDHQNKELPRKTRADAGSPSA